MVFAHDYVALFVEEFFSLITTSNVFKVISMKTCLSLLIKYSEAFILGEQVL